MQIGFEYDAAVFASGATQGSAGLAGGDGEAWYVKTGVRQRWTQLGHTVLFGEYGRKDDMFSERLASLGATESELTQ